MFSGAIQKIAFKQLASYMKEEGFKTIVVNYEEPKEGEVDKDPFRFDVFREPVKILPLSEYNNLISEIKKSIL